MFTNKKILVLGMARSGYSVAKLLASQNEIIVTDQKEQDPLLVSELESMNVRVVICDDPSYLLDDSIDILIKNPGIMPFHKTVLKAEKMGISVVNEMEVAYHFLPQDVFIIGVTGSNGKTTTTTMIYELLKKMHKSVILGGNIGFPLSEVAQKVKPKDILLLEISDHQLINFKDFKTNISILTNLCPTHLDYHGSYENYKAVKKNIFAHHTQDDIAIINFANADSLSLTSDIASHKIYFNNEDNYISDDAIYVNGERIIALDDIAVKGRHNYENILASLLAINEFGLDKEVIKDFFKSFGGVEHRIEFVLQKNNIQFYNDSKATNPTSTVIALKAFDAPVHLLLGGMERGQDFHELDEVIERCKCIYALGEVADKVVLYAEEKGIKVYKCVTIKKAMDKILENVTSGDIVLLSPASASWDQYAKFEDRGDEFKTYCKEIAKKL